MLPSWLTPAIVAVAAWAASASQELLTSVLPAAVVAVFAFADYVLWVRIGRPWHEPTVIVLLLPALVAGIWIAVGGLVTGIDRTDEARLLVEVGPGLALTGLVTTLISYHGRHRP
jgi:hypothetical protein